MQNYRYSITIYYIFIYIILTNTTEYIHTSETNKIYYYKINNKNKTYILQEKNLFNITNINLYKYIDNKTKNTFVSELCKKLIYEHLHILKNIKNSNKYQKKTQHKIIFKTYNIKKRNKKNCWQWPTNQHYAITNKCFIKNIKNTGIDILGNIGQSIVSTAKGQVVYVGNNFKKYGNLIIIKHNRNYLSVYAHNNKILVHTKQKVQTGQKIATMGNTGTNKTKLHFEIYYKGKPINLLYYLSKINP
ncbi:MAG: hypothetical protein DMNBKLKJ_00358 [Candidatus Westeberhardia cardiocondylae]|nr:hypothetical protein [Candidatus Westeberhardia cardiocondylae]